MSNLLAFMMPGGTELFIVLFIILLLFGHRLPTMMRSMGKGVSEFKKGVGEAGDDDQVESKDKDQVEAKA